MTGRQALASGSKGRGDAPAMGILGGSGDRNPRGAAPQRHLRLTEVENKFKKDVSRG